MTQPEPRSSVSQRPWTRFGRYLILVLGVLVIPFALAVILSSYGELTAPGAVRMAFGTVAGQTVSILAGAIAVVISVRLRESVLHLLLYVALEAALIVFGVNQIADASELLLTRLNGLS
jgi:hypothetical protein